GLVPGEDAAGQGLVPRPAPRRAGRGPVRELPGPLPLQPTRPDPAAGLAVPVRDGPELPAGRPTRLLLPEAAAVGRPADGPVHPVVRAARVSPGCPGREVRPTGPARKNRSLRHGRRPGAVARRSRSLRPVGATRPGGSAPRGGTHRPAEP